MVSSVAFARWRQCAPHQIVLPWEHQSLYPERHLDRFSRFWATVCKTVRPMLSDCLSVCLSVTLVYCGQTVGRIKLKLNMQVGFGPGHIAYGDPAPPPLKGHSHQFSDHLLRPNGCMDQDATWYGGRHRPRRLRVRWGPAPLHQNERSPPNFRPMFIVVKRLDGSR